SGYAAFSSMWLEDAFEKCDAEGCNGPLYPDYKRSDARGWRYEPPQIGPSTSGNIRSDDERTSKSNAVKAAAAGGGMGIAVGAAAIGSKIFFGGTAALLTPVGWGLMIGGAILIAGSVAAGYLVGLGSKDERSIVDSALGESRIEGWSLLNRSLFGEYVNVAQACASIQNGNLDSKDHASDYMNRVKSSFKSSAGKLRSECTTYLDFVRIIAPADMDEGKIKAAMNAASRSSGDFEMTDIILAGYYAQKADSLAQEGDYEGAKSYMDLATDVLRPYSCSETFSSWTLTSGKRDEMAKAIFEFLGEIKNKLVPPKSAAECLEEKQIRDGKGGCKPCPEGEKTLDGESCVEWRPSHDCLKDKKIQDGEGGCKPCPSGKFTTDGKRCRAPKASGGGTNTDAPPAPAPADEWGGSNPYN
nr:hypothetical protein [bacterium]